MQKNYRFSKKQEGTVLLTSKGANLKVKFDSSKKHLPLPSSSYINARVRWLWMAVKNPFLFSII